MDLINKLSTSLSNSEYHGMGGTYSSSQLKAIITDPELFYKKYITKELAKEEGSQFDVGTYFHTAILEPHNLEKECAVYPGKRIGKAWEEFKELHKGKAIITDSDLHKTEGIIKAVKSSPIATKVLDGCNCEVSAFIEIYIMVDDGLIFSIKNNQVYYLNFYFGWLITEAIEIETLKEFAVKLILKTRADAINLKENYIADLKSTSGNCKNEREMRNKISDYDYDLSASLYLDVFALVTGEAYKDFYWIFASKDTLASKTWLASEENVRAGRAKWATAVILIAKYTLKNWKFEDELGVLSPNEWEKEWVNKAEYYKELEL